MNCHLKVREILAIGRVREILAFNIWFNCGFVYLEAPGKTLKADDEDYTGSIDSFRGPSTDALTVR